MKHLLAIVTLLAFQALAQAAPQDWGPTTSPTWVATLAPAVPASLAGSGTYAPCVAMSFARAFDVYAELAGASTLQVQRYADPPDGQGIGGCTFPVGAAVPASAQALTTGGGCPGSTHCGDVGSNDGTPFMAIKITVTDTSGSTNAITTVVPMQGAE